MLNDAVWSGMEGLKSQRTSGLVRGASSSSSLSLECSAAHALTGK